MNKKLTKEQKEYIIENKNKLTIKQIANDTNLNESTIGSFLQRNKLSAKKTKEVFWKNLTETECCVLRLIAKGYDTKEIAEKLFNSICTVKSHINNIFSKLNISNDKGSSTLRLQAALMYLDYIGNLKDWEYKGKENL